MTAIQALPDRLNAASVLHNATTATSATVAPYTADVPVTEGLRRRAPPLPPPLPPAPAGALVAARPKAKTLRPCPSQRALGSLAPASRDSVRNATLIVQRNNLNDSSNNRAPGAAGDEVAHMGSTNVTTYRWSIASGGGGDGTALQGDRYSFSVVETRFDGGDRPWYACATLCLDQAAFGLSTDPEHGVHAGGVLQLQQRYTTVGGVTAITLADGYVLGGGLGLRLQAEGSLRLLDTRGAKVLLQQQLSCVRGPQLTGGVGIPWVGLGGRFLHTQNRQSTLRSWVPRDRAQALLRRESGGLLQRGRHSLTALGLRAPALALPALTWHDDDMGLPVGDELQLTHTGSTTGGLALALAGVLLGGYGAWQNETVLAVRRRDAHNVDVAYTWRRSRATTAGLEVPILAGVHNVHLGAEAVCEGFTCDLRSPPAQRAYANMLRGKLPALQAPWQKAPADVRAVACYLRHEELPSGVARLLLESLRVPDKAARGGGIAVPWYVPHFHIPGLKVEYRQGTELHWQATAREVVYSENWQTEWHHQAPRLGLRSGVTFVAPQDSLVRPEGLSQLQRHLTVGMRLTYDRFGGQRTRGGLVDTLNRDVLGRANLPYFIDPDRACGYAVRVQRVFDDADLAFLSRTPAPPAAQQAMGAKACAQLRRALPAAHSLAQRRLALRDFVQGAPGRALGALHRWLDANDQRLHWHVEYTAAAELLQQSRALQLVHEGPLQANAAAACRVRKLAPLRQQLAAELHDVRLDPILMQLAAWPQVQEGMEKELQAHLQAVDARLTVEHLAQAERVALRARLGRKLAAKIFN